VKVAERPKQMSMDMDKSEASRFHSF